MNQISTKINFLIVLISLTFVHPSFCQNGLWKSNALSSTINFKVSDSTHPRLDYDKNKVTIIYLEGVKSCRVKDSKRKKEIKWFLNQGYRIVELDYAGNELAVSPNLNKDIVSINDSIASGKFCELSDCSKNKSFVLFEGYRIKENVPYFIDNPKVYNTPKEYVRGDTLFMDIIYPASSKNKVPVILSFSYSNSYATFDSDKKMLIDRNKHQRVNLGYTFAGFNDSFLEGAPLKGMAWAIADHPKYCSWGKGKRTGGSNDEYKSYETNPDTGQKVKSAIRTLRGLSKELNFTGKIGVFGFSRGSTAGSMAIGDKKDPVLENAGFYRNMDDGIQAAILGPGVFDYTMIYDKKDDGDRNMEFRCPLVWGDLKDNYDLWKRMGSSYLVETSATSPVLFFYNTTDEIYYQDQIKQLKAKLDSLHVPNSEIIDFSKGHAVPTDAKNLTIMYDFFKKFLF